MNILVTGAAGFLGSHLMLHYLKMGHHVLGIDNYSSSDSSSEHNVETSAYRNGLLLEGDICCSRDISDCISDFWHTFEPLSYNQLDDVVNYDLQRFHLVYNMACPASPPRYQAQPIETTMACTLGVKNMLEIARENKCPIVHASTSEVYGDPNVSPQPESYRGNVNTWGDRANYDEGKRCAETLCYEYLKKGVDVRVMRIFNTYGEHMDPDDGRVVTNFIKQALRGVDLTVYGTGEQTRSLCYVNDLVDAIVCLGEASKGFTGPINLGNPHEITVNELAQTIIALTSSSSRVVYRDLPSDDPHQRCPDITLARRLLKWNPTTDLKTGLNKMISYMKMVI